MPVDMRPAPRSARTPGLKFAKVLELPSTLKADTLYLLPDPDHDDGALAYITTRSVEGIVTAKRIAVSDAAQEVFVQGSDPSVDYPAINFKPIGGDLYELWVNV